MSRVLARRQRGMSLIELLLASALLAAGLVVALSALRTAVRTVASAELLADASEEMRTTRSLLRRQLAQAHAAPWTFDNDGLPVYVSGDPASLRFVAPLPGIVAHGGLYVQSLWIERHRDGHRLMFGYRMLDDGIEDDRDDGAPDQTLVLVEHLQAGHFAYRGLDEDGMLGEWEETWERPGQLPLFVRIELSPGDTRVGWPELVLPLRLGGASGLGMTPLERERSRRRIR